MTDPQTFDEKLDSIEAFKQALLAGEIETGEAMQQYREVIKPRIRELEQLLTEYRAMLDETAAAGEPQPAPPPADVPPEPFQVDDSDDVPF